MKKLNLKSFFISGKPQFSKVGFWVVCLTAFLCVFGCIMVYSASSYSALKNYGDAAFFLEYCGSMGLGEYLKWRYETWTGRMISEAFMHNSKESPRKSAISCTSFG